jgi:poly(3-hydroxybutyrate) depolymerase
MKRLTLVLLVILGPSHLFAQDIQKQVTQIGGKPRAYYLFVPDKLSKDQPAPLVLLLHGSGRTGNSLVEKWKDLAKKEKIILVGPDSLNTQMWKAPVDGPGFLYDLITELQTKYPIDSRRLYVFGHSGGAGFALYMGLFESDYFAAIAIHAGALRPDDGPIVERASRKIPFHIAVGTNDNLFPLKVVRDTRDLLVKHGFTVDLVEMKNHNHWYYDRAPEINATAWTFLKDKKLSEDPRYTRYN